MGVVQPLSQLGETHVSDLQLPPFRNELEFEFLTADFRSGTHLRYQYILEGVSDHWSLPSDERRVHYAGLMPGVYRFLVRAVSAEGKSSPLPATLSITVLEPFWRTWWFISLEAVMVSLLVYGLHRYRLAQLLALERIRTRIAADLHDDIGSSLSQVAILSEVVRRRIGESDPEIVGHLTRIGEISRNLVDSMGDIVWAINPAKDKLFYLAQRIRDFADDVFAAGDIQLQFRAPERDHNLAIGADTRRQVFLILKECVHNIVRHAKCTRVDIDIRVEGKRLVVEVHDDGVGFEPSAAVNGHGLASMRNRARRLGGKITFAARDQGTAVTLDVPLATSVHDQNPHEDLPK
jgi:signal transduction histidine kinase